ncbi:hydantoinase/oxoprolinase family protein [Oceanicella sp. SM1341]|uniref:hydantoinase/oxoprolinase family protein n=1 Tax=Oceanicella sp. SM1341 TaxID=1548889 RepID=UPI000E4A9028|nr:hydantoinase/oxoprolinase family protein [Oceanicella sp. SM1341]
MDRTISIAVDTGGTFTDVSLVDRGTGAFHKAKTPSTPDDPSRGFLAGLRRVLADNGLGAEAVSHVFHGTTVATNAILEMQGADCALLTTTGFRHVLEIGRHDIPRTGNIYAWVKPERPVPPEHIWGIDGRMTHEGAELAPLDEAMLRAAVADIRAKGLRSVAVCYLHSYANPAHELRTREIIAEEFPEAQVSLSAEVLPAFREFERSMAVLLNAYVMPKVSGYVSRLEAQMAGEGIGGRLLLMQSSGGVTGAGTIRNEPIHTALSGPAAGVVGAGVIGRQAGEPRLISFDVGGTSADICLIDGAEASVTTEGRVGEWPLGLPMIDIHTIGAGGGSIARVVNGALVVGPASAGAVPGPVCYGRGGTEPTLTDAHLVLGHLTPRLLDGEMLLDRAAAERAIETHVAAPLGLSVLEAATGIVEIANANMVGAIRVVSVERGHDPAEFALVPFGGAGPLHGGFLMRLLGMRAALVAPEAGVLSAMGLLHSDLKKDFTRTCILRAPDYDLARLEEVFAGLDAGAREWLSAEAIPPSGQEIDWVVGMRYLHQGFELTVDWPGRAVTREALAQAIEGFHAAHRQLYTFDQPEVPVELVFARVSARGSLGQPADRAGPAAGPMPEPSEVQQVWAEGAWQDCPVHDRRRLPAGARLHGPAIIEQLDATTYILPGQVATVDGFGNLILREA